MQAGGLLRGGDTFDSGRDILVSVEMCKTPGSRIGSENEFSTWKAQVVSDTGCVLHPVTRLGKTQRKSPGRRFPVQHVHRHTHTCVDAGTVARDTTPGRLYCVVGVCGARTPGRRFRATR